MKRLILVFLLGPVLAFAASPVSVQLDNVKLIDLARIVYSDMLHKPYIIDSDAVALQDVVTLDITGIKPEQLEVHLNALLELHGFEVEKRPSVYIIGKRKSADEEAVIYRPKYRGVNYLLDLTTALFPPGSFSARASTQMPGQGISALTQPAQGVASAAQSQPASVQPAHAGQNVPFVPSSPASTVEPDTLIFHGKAEHAAKLEKLLAKLDVPGAEMMIKAVIYEVQRGQKDISAVDLAMKLFSGKLGLNLVNGGLATAAATISTGGVQAVITELSTDSRFKLISSPSVRVRDGVQARFSVGADVPVLGAVTYPKDGQPVQSVDYKPSGVILQITPRIRGQGAELQILQQLSNFIPTTTGVNNSPTLTKREASTTVNVGNDDLVILGGLDEDKTTDSRSGLSFLPSWLGSDSSDRQRTEILLVMQVQRL